MNGDVPVVRLTEREFQIYHALLRRERKDDIASRLKMSHGTLSFHIRNIYKKLGVNTWSEFLLIFGHFEVRLVWVANKEAPQVFVANYGRSGAKVDEFKAAVKAARGK